MSESPETMDPDSMRALIRQVLSDVLPDAASGTGSSAGVPVSPSETTTVKSSEAVASQTTEQVSIRSDEELHAFVLRLLAMFENPKHRTDLRAGRFRFVLTAGSQPGRTAPSRRIDKGAVTEAQVKDAATVGASLLLGRRAVLTPLARDKARALGVVIEREA